MGTTDTQVKLGHETPIHILKQEAIAQFVHQRTNKHHRTLRFLIFFNARTHCVLH